jgi:hypothetical protein
MDFVVVIRVRQRFGSNSEPEGVEASAPFVGRSKEYGFDCPGVDRSSEAILNFQVQGVQHARNRMEVNGVELAGGVPMGGVFGLVPPVTNVLVFFGVWSGQVLIVPPNTLRALGNRLLIDARNADGGTNGGIPNFIVDNVVLLFATRAKPPEIGPVLRAEA